MYARSSIQFPICLVYGCELLLFEVLLLQTDGLENNVVGGPEL